MPENSEPTFVNMNHFAVSIQNERGVNMFVQPFSLYQAHNPATHKGCVVRGEFYRRYIAGGKGPLWPFPAEAQPVAAVVAPIPAVAAPPAPAPANDPQTDETAGGPVDESAGETGAQEQAETPPPAGSTNAPAPATPTTAALKLGKASMQRLRVSVEQSEREDVTQEDVQTMVLYILAKRNRKTCALPPKLESFASDLNEIAANRDPHKPTEPIRG